MNNSFEDDLESSSGSPSGEGGNGLGDSFELTLPSVGHTMVKTSSLGSIAGGVDASAKPSASGSSKLNSKRSYRNLMLLVSIVLVTTQLLGVFLFSKGFFPRKSSLEGYNSFANYPPSCTDSYVDVEPQFGRMVFMLVDAFRSQFLFSEEARVNMNFTRSLVDQGRSYAYVARANAPTVTLPRIKALLSGGIPSFVDFVMNFNSKDLKDDNILWQIKHTANKTMVFYGDDTWLKLFPDYFKRSDGTTSFYVADTVEVDNNVTRHLDSELGANQDWDFLFLHYLGLDHIGHLEGPYSNLMAPKQRELDAIIERIHTALLASDKEELDRYHQEKERIEKEFEGNEKEMEKRLKELGKEPLPTLFVFCSDHGMNEIGNHGGSTDAETSAVLMLMSSLYYHQNDPAKKVNLTEVTEHEKKLESENKIADEGEEIHSFGRLVEVHESEIIPRHLDNTIKEVDQVDLVPSLSFLFNLPIPRNSLGKVIPELFSSFLPDEQYLRALEINCQQQIEILKNNQLFWKKKENKPTTQSIQSLLNLFSDAQQYHSSWYSSPSHSHFNEKAGKLYLEFLTKIHQEFKRLLTSFDENLLVIGLLSIGSSALVTLLISTASISLSERSSKHVEIQGVSFSLSFICIVGVIMAIHFGFICSNENNQDQYYCTTDFRYVVLSFICTTLSLIIGANIILSRNNLKLFQLSSATGAGLRKEKYILIFGNFLYLISLFGSSLVEEEHQTWYYLTTTVILLQITPHSISILNYFSKKDSKKNHLRDDNKKKTLLSSKYQTKVSLKQMLILLFILVTLRIMKVWNQTGIKWLDDPNLVNNNHFVDVGRYLNHQNNFFSTVLLWIFSLVSIIIPNIYVFKLLDDLKTERKGGNISQKLSFLYKTIIIIISILLFCYKWNYIPSEILIEPLVARLVYFGIGLLMLITFLFPFFAKKTQNPVGGQSITWFITILRYLPILILVNMMMFFLLIHKTHNMILLIMMGAVAHYYLKYLLEDTGRRAKSGMVGVCVGLICINWLGQFGYFALGNSNSLATIDISGSYTGVLEYNQYLVGSLTYLIGYTSQIFFFFVGLVYATHLAINSISPDNQVEPSLTLPIPANPNEILGELQTYTVVGTLLDCGIKWTGIFVFSICVLIQRFHLFIWTVFSPKYIYQVMDISLVLFKAILFALFIFYLKTLITIREIPIFEKTFNRSTSINSGKDE